MLSYVSYRTPKIRSSLGRRFIPRSATGGGGDLDPSEPQVVTEIVHKPGFWHAYGRQTAIFGVVFLLGLFGMVIGLFANVNPREYSTWIMFVFLPSGILLIAGVVMPILYHHRYRKMARVFDDAQLDELDNDTDEGGASPVAPGAKDAATVVARHPNPGRFVHSTWISLLVGILVMLSMLELAAGFLLLFYVDSLTVRTAPGPTLHVFSVALVIQGFASLGLAYAIKQHHMRALGWVIVLSLLSVVAAVATLQWYLVVYAVVTCAIFWWTGLSLRKIDAEIATPDKADPLEACYHNLLLLLVYVMRADGHCDRRELSKIARLCNDMNLSDYERDLVITSANEHPAEPLKEVVMRYRIAAEVAQIPDPAESLIVAALAVASADGILTSEERSAICDMAKQVGVDAALYEAALAVHAPPDHMNEDFARALLNVTADSDALALEAAHGELRAELQAAHYAHLGRRLAETLQERLTLVDEAYDLLHRAAPSPTDATGN